MQPFQALHLFFLIWLTTTLNKAQDFSEPLRPCREMCGDVIIRYPFGIGDYCSFNEWFHVDCKSSTPYLSALNNVQLLTIESKKLVLVGMPVIYNADCKNPVQNSILDIISTTHGKSPFRFSGDYNKLVFQGCGGASIMEENGSIITGCSTTCRNDTISDINNCFGVGCCEASIPRDLESFTLKARQDGDGTCGSAFLINIKNFNFKDLGFVPITLSWGYDNMCGEVSIPYPFGIGINFSRNGIDFTRNKWYNVDCKSSTPYLSAFKNLEVLGVDLESQSVTVNVSMISDCENPIQNSSLVLSTESPFEFSKIDNLFIFEGCGNAAIVDENGTIVGGCSMTCGDDTVSDTNNCFGVGCCIAEIPYDDYENKYKSLTFNLTGLKRQAENGSCAGSAFMVDRTSFNKRRFSRQFVPITLYWGNLVPESQGSKGCIYCQYLGGYCTTNDYETRICRLYGGSNGGSKKGVILGVSISMGLLFLMVTSYALYKIIKKTKAKRRKQRFFKRNGGILLKQQQATDISLVDKTILFTSNELEKATDHFNENRILGRGGQGTVYKGMLADGRIVAIKKSKVIDERQLEQFINEVVVLSQVNHRNVVKLLGCCLETEVPLLVSEFIPNGTLYDLIQDETDEFSFSLNIRLQIASEVSGAVSYLHSATSIPIYHRDIKTTNILLDEKYRAKVSDFGTSRLVSVDQTHLTTLVKGTFGYLDPEYFQSSQFTEKSDVYSFGVVLLELLTREKPLSLTRFGENRSLATHFLLAMKEGWVMSIFDSMVVKEGFGTELMAVANLAMRCLNVSGKNRPTMKEVFIELEGIRLSHVPPTVQTNFGQVKPREEIQVKYDESASTSMTFDDNISR